MSNITFEVTEIQIILNTAIRIVTAFLFLAFIIPLQIKEAQVKNGLLILRRELLVSGVIMFLVNTIGLTIILLRYFFGDAILKPAIEIISLFNSIGFLIIASIKYHIYNSQYTPENKRLHAKIDRLERSKKS